MSAADYHAKYPPLKPFNGPNDYGKALALGGDKHLMPLVTRKRMFMYPGMDSFHPKVLKFQDAFATALNEQVKPEVDKQTGYSTNGVHTTFDTLRTVPGYMSNPMSAIMVHNKEYRASLGLEAGYDVVGRAIARNVWELIWSRYKPSAIKVTKKSSGGAPRFTNDAEWKIDFAMFAYEQNNFDKICKLVLAEDWLTLANEFEMLWMLYMQKRDQVDTIEKQRFVFDKIFAETGGKEGWSGNADKSVNLPGVENVERFVATRARNIQAAVWTVNCICSIVSTGTMQAMFEDYPQLFHTNTPEEIERAVNGHEVYASDVKEYDRSMSEDALDVVFETARKYWSEPMVRIAERLMFACYYSRPLEMDGKRGFWMGKLFASERQIVAGNRSGHNWTSLVAKINKVIDELIALARMGLPILGNERKYMKQQGVVKLVNNGDDNLTCGTKTFIDRYAHFRDDPKTGPRSGHYLVGREVGCVYSGNVLMRPDLSVARYKPVSRLATAFQKIYCNERSVGGHMRPMWDIGIHVRIRDAEKHPYGGLAWEIHNRLFRDILEPTFGSFNSLLIRGAKERKEKLDYDISVTGLTQQERSVIDDPADLSWRGYTDTEVRPWVQELLGVGRIQFQHFEHIVKQHYKGTLV